MKDLPFNLCSRFCWDLKLEIPCCKFGTPHRRIAFKCEPHMQHVINQIIIFCRCRCRRQSLVILLFSDVNVEIVETLSNIASRSKPPLYRKRKVLVRLRVQGNGNEGVKWGKTRERFRERAERSLMYHIIAQVSLQDMPSFREITIRMTEDQMAHI